VRARDTTGAGDSFNGGYLACRLAGLPVLDSARFGAKLAACVVMYPGAIMPSDQMPPLPAGLTP
jgi:2-dehydro-3-deoxygluconokinase